MTEVNRRSTALAIGLGLVYLLFERFVDGFAELSAFLTYAAKALPGPNAGSLAAALSPTSDTPGVVALAGTTQATLVLFAYITGFILVSILLFLKCNVI